MPAARPLVRPRALVLAALCLLVAAVLGASMRGEHAPAVAGVGALSAAQGGQSLLPATAQASVSAALGAADPAYRVTRADGGFRTVNPAQQMSVRFTPAGVQLRSRAADVELSLRALGYGNSLQAVAAPRLSGGANRAVYTRSGVQESYVNGPLGLEQGFTLQKQLPGTRGEPLTLAMALTGNTRASLAKDGQRMTLAGAGGASLHYGGLRVTDARGRTLHSWLELHGRTLLLRADTAGAQYPLRIDPLIDSEVLSGGTESRGALFGFSVALSADGNTAIVGGKYASGAAWVFTRSGSTWKQQGSQLKIEEEGGEQCVGSGGECGFGRSVALSADGNTALIGGPQDDGNRGAAWVFTRSGSTWTQQGGALTGGEEQVGEGRFGQSVALSADGDTALVGGPKVHHNRGAAWVFTRSGSAWMQQGGELTAGEEEGREGRFGASVALSADGGTALIGGRTDEEHLGAAWVFTRSGSNWEQQGTKLTGGTEESGEGRFGSSVALSAFGNTALIGGRTDDGGLGAAWVFTRSGATWQQQGAKLTGGAEENGEGEFGASVALSANGEIALVGAPRDGAIGATWSFAHVGGGWQQQGPKRPSPEADTTDRFGTGVALSADGSSALIGGPGHRNTYGQAWVFASTSTAQAPTVESVSPNFGPAAGDTAVTIKGSGFLPGIAVDIGGEASSVEVLSETELTAVTPAHAPGKQEVVVLDEDGISAGGPMYTFVAPPPPPAPTVTSIAPESGSSVGGTLVTIKGSGFLTGATVDIGGEASSVEVLSETELTAVTPAHAPGGQEVIVSDGNGTSSGGPTFTFIAPQLPLVIPAGAAGGTPQGSAGVLSSKIAVLPPPRLGVTGNLAPVSGTVLVKLPGSSKFVLLTGVLQVPFGTIIDALHGKVKVTTMGPNGRLQVMTFYAGEFKLTQQRNGRVFATLWGGNFSTCPTRRERSHIALAQASSSHTSGKHTVRKLWAEGHGSYSTKGNYASGAVLGTVWLTEDKCDGTLIRVKTDSVEVTNFVTHHHYKIRAGHSYLAKAP
jgi:hypothetical protein